MKSRITIELDFENGNEPLIQIVSRISDDVRDRLVSQFLQNLSHTSTWCKILYIGGFINTQGEGELWNIKPLKVSEIPSEIDLMQAVIKSK